MSVLEEAKKLQEVRAKLEEALTKNSEIMTGAGETTTQTVEKVNALDANIVTTPFPHFHCSIKNAFI